MKIFLSGADSSMYSDGTDWLSRLNELNLKLKWNLVSYFYVRKGLRKQAGLILRDNSELLMVDSGAHSFQKGKRVDWEEYTREYAKFITEFDRPNVIGYFEMDIDAITGYEKVLYLRKILESVSNKIIPVWHKNRGIAEYDKMCRDYAGKIIAISGFKNEDIRDYQYMMFLKHAKKYGCKVHALGMTRTSVLDKVPFDYTDSSSWRQAVRYGRKLRNSGESTSKVNSDWLRIKENTQTTDLFNYRQALKKQLYYYDKWRLFDEDTGGIGWRQLIGQSEDNLSFGV